MSTSTIPVYELHHENEEVAFAIRSTRDVEKMFGAKTDKPHRHNYYTVLWSHNQGGIHIVDYKEFDIRPNDIFFVSPGQVHQVKHNDEHDGTVILFTCEFLDRNSIHESFISNLNLFSEVESTPPIQVNVESAKRLGVIVDNMLDALKRNERYKNEMIGAYLKLFLIECNSFAHPPIPQNTQAEQSGKIIIRKFKELLDQHFTEWKKVAVYSQELGITPDYLNSVVKNTVGKSAKELIQQRIVLEAKRLGLHTDLTTKEIAYQIGFQDPSHFSKFFSRQEGYSFSSFRQQLNQELSG